MEDYKLPEIPNWHEDGDVHDPAELFTRSGVGALLRHIMQNAFKYAAETGEESFPPLVIVGAMVRQDGTLSDVPSVIVTSVPDVDHMHTVAALLAEKTQALFAGTVAEAWRGLVASDKEHLVGKMSAHELWEAGYIERHECLAGCIDHARIGNVIYQVDIVRDDRSVPTPGVTFDASPGESISRASGRLVDLLPEACRLRWATGVA